MAELALAITGLALAWKGVVDFGTLIAQLAESDTRQRDVLILKLQCSQFQLKDWGDYWGIDRDDGRFHSFERERKELIMGIILQLRDSRTSAMETLKKKYGMLNDAEEQAPSVRLSIRVSKTISIMKRGTSRTQWVMFDRDVIKNLVKETLELHENLNTISTLSPKFIDSHLSKNISPVQVEARLAFLEAQFKSFTPNSGAMRVSSDDTQSIDGKTIAAFASKSIPSSEQMDRVQRYIHHAFDHDVDSRAAEHVADWWNDERSGILLLEVPDDPYESTSTSLLAVMYYMADCYKLIYIFELENSLGPAHQFGDMLSNLMQSLLSIQSEGLPDGQSVQIAQGFLEKADGRAINTEVLSELLTMFQELLEHVLKNIDRPVVILVDSLDFLDFNETHSETQQFCNFLVKLQDACHNRLGGVENWLKVLFGHRGHANVLYKYEDRMKIVDLTDRAVQVSNLREDLASKLHGSVH